MHILHILAITLLIWVNWGMIVAILKCFVYWRGPRHMVESYISHPVTKDIGLKMQKDCKERYEYIFFGTLIASVICPPLLSVDLFNDFLLFTWFPYLDSKNKT